MLAMRNVYRSPFKAELHATQDGYITCIDAWKTGHAAIDLGVGRNRTEDAVSPVAGVELHKKGGAPVRRGELIMTVWGKDEAGLTAAMPQLESAVEYADAPVAKRCLVLKELCHT
jgi:pyrimidine-nucleoside phosphorylase